ncbi:hypothetical protein ABT262_49840, partial [Amycolatopsis mediterranei]
SSPSCIRECDNGVPSPRRSSAAEARAAAERAVRLLDPAEHPGTGYRGPAVYAARACARDLLAALGPAEDDRRVRPSPAR